jgi:hypothetical protein
MSLCKNNEMQIENNVASLFLEAFDVSVLMSSDALGRTDVSRCSRPLKMATWRSWRLSWRRALTWRRRSRYASE